MPANTPIFGLPYPLGTDPVSQGDNDIRALADGIEAGSGLWLIKTDTITSGSSKEITAVFSSSYSAYKIVVDNFESSVAGILRMRMGTANSGYYSSGVISTYASGAVSGEFINGGSEWLASAVSEVGHKASTQIEVFQPFATVRTSYTSTGIDARVGGAGLRNYAGFKNDTTSYTSFSLLLVGANFVSCNVAVYGYNN